MNKKATNEDIECVRAMLVTHLLATPPRTVASVRSTARLLDRVDRVMDAASAMLADDVTEPEVPGEWVEWEGGACPVEPTTRVEVELRRGRPYPDHADNLRWNHLNDVGDIVKYRIID